MKILAIETSCDETAAAVVLDGRIILSNVIASQVEIHKIYGGVVPEIASRNHIKDIGYVIDKALAEANETFDSVDAIAVTYGPGLIGALLVGVSTAKAMSYARKKPLIGVHHIKGHIAANYIADKNFEPPFICLVASGGHSHIIHVKDYTKFEVLGYTRDDAAGEAFDKVARLLGLGYPGGPLLEKLAKEGNEDAISFPKVTFKDRSFDFSFSGVKTAVCNYIHNANQKGIEINPADVAASFQKSVVDVLVDKTLACCINNGVKKVALAGGVAANNPLRKSMEIKAEKSGLEFYYPPLDLCTDNAAMIGSAGYYQFLENDFSGIDLNGVANLEI